MHILAFAYLLMIQWKRNGSGLQNLFGKTNMYIYIYIYVSTSKCFQMTKMLMIIYKKKKDGIDLGSIYEVNCKELVFVPIWHSLRGLSA